MRTRIVENASLCTGKWLPNMHHNGRQSNTHHIDKTRRTESNRPKDLPTETIQNIMRHLPFQDIMKQWRVNKRFWLLVGMKSLWKDITISNTPLSCGLISVAISKQVNTLNIRNCSIQGRIIEIKIPRPTSIQRKRHPGRNHHSRIYRIGDFRPIREQILHGRDRNRQNEERQ